MTSSALIQLDNQRKNQRQQWVLVRGLGSAGEVLDGVCRGVMSDVGRITNILPLLTIKNDPC